MKRHDEGSIAKMTNKMEASTSSPGDNDLKYKMSLVECKNLLENKEDNTQYLRHDKFERASPAKNVIDWTRTDTLRRLRTEQLEGREFFKNKYKETYDEVLNVAEKAQDMEGKYPPREKSEAQNRLNPPSLDYKYKDQSKVLEYFEAKDLEQKLTLLQLRNSQYQEKLVALEKLIEVKDGSIEQLEKALSLHQVKIEELSSDLSHMNCLMKSEKAKAEDARIHHTNQLNFLSDSHEKDKEALRSQYEEINFSLKERINCLQREIDSKEEEYLKIKAENDQLNSENEILQGEICGVHKKKKEELEDIGKHLQETQSQVSTLLTKLQNYQKECDKLQEENKLLKYQIEEKDIQQSKEIESIKQQNDKDTEALKLVLEQRAALMNRDAILQSRKKEIALEPHSPVIERVSRFDLDEKNKDSPPLKEQLSLSFTLRSPISIARAPRDPAIIQEENINYTIKLLKEEKEELFTKNKNLLAECEALRALCDQQKVRISTLQTASDSMQNEQNQLGVFSKTIKNSVAELEQKFALQDECIKVYRQRIIELETHIKDLSRQLEKWAISSYGKTLIAAPLESSFGSEKNGGSASARSLKINSPGGRTMITRFSALN